MERLGHVQYQPLCATDDLEDPQRLLYQAKVPQEGASLLIFGRERYTLKQMPHFMFLNNKTVIWIFKSLEPLK